MNKTFPQLIEFREQIDAIDTQIYTLLAKRFEISKQIGIFKQKENLPIIDRVREDAQFERIRALANELGLDPKLACRVLREVIDQVIKEHKSLATKG
jgi:chorismate mutase